MKFALNKNCISLFWDANMSYWGMVNENEIIITVSSDSFLFIYAKL